MGNTGDIQLWGLLYACGLGFWLGLYYELFRTLRLLLPPTARGCFFQDVFFCLSAALVTFFCFLSISDGNMYPYLFIGEMAGFFSFYCTLGRVFHKILGALLRLLLLLFRRIKRWISRPLYALYRWIFVLFMRIYTAICRKFAEIRKKPNFFSKKT